MEAIFRKFGSYPISDLAKMLNELHHNIPFEKKVDEFNFVYNYLDSDKFLEFLNSEHSNNLYKDNEIFNFIKRFNNMTFNKNIQNNSQIKMLIKTYPENK